MTERFIFATDLHYGYERRGGHKVPLHDITAFRAMMAFARDFRPHHFILGGDILDCGVVSHHNHGKPGRTEGMKLLQDAAECRHTIIEPIEAITTKTLTYIVGNHEAWLTDLTDDQPTLDGLVNLRPLLKLGAWRIIDQGGYHRLGKLYFIHGDQIAGGTNAARTAVDTYMQNVRLGHYHTMQSATKTSAVDMKLGKTGIVVPCLCGKDPLYNDSKPNRWMQGFNFGYVDTKTGMFTDYVPTIIDGGFFGPHGKRYTG